MATFVCRVQFLDDTDPFNSTNFPEPTRPPHYTFREDIPLINQIAGIHRLLRAPHKLDDCALQLSHNGTYLDLESSLAEQRDELEGFQEDSGRGKKHSVILRTQLSVRVHACIEKLYNSNGRELRRALFSLKQIFQDDKDLVHEFVMAEGLTCLIKVGAEADQNYQNYILRALGQIMLYVDGMNGVIGHSETIQWLYSLVGSKFRLVVKTALKLLLVFVEYAEANAPLLVQAVDAVDTQRGHKLWSNAMEILDEKDGVDTELLVYAMTLINKTLSGLPDQDSFYDLVDALEEQGMEAVARRHLSRKATDRDLVEQFNIYETTLRHEDGDDDTQPPPAGCKDRRRSSVGGGSERRGLERRRSRRHSLGRNSAPASPGGPNAPAHHPLAGQSSLDASDRVRRGHDTLHLPMIDAVPVAPLLDTVRDISQPGLPCGDAADFEAATAPDQEEGTVDRSPPDWPDSAQPSILASLLAQRKSSISVPPLSEAAPCLRGAVSPSPEHLPYLPHSPFHLFSYDFEEGEVTSTLPKAGQIACRHPGVSGPSPCRSYSALSPPPTPTTRYGTSVSPSLESNNDRAVMGNLLSSSYRQHQESLAAERERRRVEREERLLRIEREERNRFSRDFADKMEEARHAREERYKHVERIAAEEYERERVKVPPKGRGELNLSLSPTRGGGSSRSTTPSSIESQEESETPPTAGLPSERETAGEADSIAEGETEASLDVEPEVSASGLEGEQEPDQEEEEEDGEFRSKDGDGTGAVNERSGEADLEADQEASPERETEDSAVLSEKERQNEEVNEKDNCSASSISSASSTLEREERLNSSHETAGQWTQGIKDVDVNEQCNTILTSKRFMLDMLYAQNKKPLENDEEEEEEESEKEKGQENEDSTPPAQSNRTSSMGDSCHDENGKDVDTLNVDNQGSVRAFAEKFGDLVKGLVSPPLPESSEKQLTTEKPALAPLPPKKESDYIWDQLMTNPRELRIRDMDFTDLGEEDDADILDTGSVMGSGEGLPPPPPPPTFSILPPPPPLFGCPPPPLIPGMRFPPPPPSSTPAPPLQPHLGSPQFARGEPPVFHKKKKTIRLFWSEVRAADFSFRNHKRYRDSLWAKMEPVKVDTSKLEHLFETKSKEMPVTKKTAADGKRQEIIVLDSKRSNAINIGLTVLPPPRTIKTAILSFDEYALNKEGIEKILTMIPTEEEKQKIQEAQLANPDVPLGSAEQFLLTLSSISELSARLQLWAFKMDYEVMEKEVAEPLQDLKEGMDQLENNRTLQYILSTLLSIGNFLNGSNAKGFELSYLEKVPEVKDTIHKQSLLHHACTIVVEKFQDSTDLYSEIGAITRCAKVDFDQLQENLCQMERRCKASWDHLKVIAKHEMKSVLKQKMSDFLKDCAERIIILKIIHRRIVNRFHAFLLFLGQPAYAVREVSIQRFSKTVSEFALEYRTTRDRVLQQQQKRADHRERNKTRGKMITDTDDEEDSEGGKLSSNPSAGQDSEPQGLQHAEDAAEHENMKAVLRGGLRGGDSEAASMPGLRIRTRATRGRLSSWATANEDSPNGTEDAADEIMERIVKSATQGPSQRTLPRERKRSRANRKSLRRTLKSGLTPEEAHALGLTGGPEMQV
ncbi:FH1/FH2 domain-containing protein 3-like isoform X3 [Paramormyrops kingsleyae]|uniref:FH1/FH2 domain-containing protein 3-like isoform X3 n=1 Tax=Paramormyrops kingsleyae TaxID=1676925 RepID=UPI000CD5F034|nr:FH1/FH2 domain-containing protein 3-like isoform X1 [Paramormyrops kingsleyae]